MSRYALLAALAGIAAVTLSGQFRPVRRPVSGPAANSLTEGTLYRLDGKGAPADVCPLKHTDVKAHITGFLARVTVTQEFVNPIREKIEAVYRFPLPPQAAVDDMRMQIGDRTVVGAHQDRAKRRAQSIDAARGRRPDRESARPGTSQHLHPVGGQHRTRAHGEDHDQLRGDHAVRRRRLYVHVPDGGGSAVHSGQTGRSVSRTPPTLSPAPHTGRHARRARSQLEVTLDAGVPVNDIAFSHPRRRRRQAGRAPRHGETARRRDHPE